MNRFVNSKIIKTFFNDKIFNILIENIQKEEPHCAKINISFAGNDFTVEEQTARC